jgi:DNA adenine methylase
MLASQILAYVEGRRFRRLYEPFAGSGAVTIAAARTDLAGEYRLSDTLAPLMEIWQRMMDAPTKLADEYEAIWQAQHTGDSLEHFNRVRRDFNESGGAARLLYLLARCVKNSPRFNKSGEFNQSPDKRRAGMRPAKMRSELARVSALLASRAIISASRFEDALSDAGPSDLVYLDPPWEGTTNGHDRRYHEGMDRQRLIDTLVSLHAREIPFLLSYDGRHGTKRYGDPLPESINAERFDLHAGRSSQATLLGRHALTIESLYVSKALLDVRVSPQCVSEQLSLLPA